MFGSVRLLPNSIVRLSIRYQLFIPLALLLAGLVGICGWTAYASAEQARQRIALQIEGISQTLRDGQYPLNPHVLEQMKGLSGADFVLVERDGNRMGTVDVSGFSKPMTVLGVDQPTRRSLSKRIEVGDRVYLYDHVALPPTHPHALGHLYVLYPESQLRAAVWQAVRPPLLLGVSGGLAAIMLTLVVGQQMVQRVRDLEQRTRVIAGGDFSLMPLPSRNDELRDLAQSVNDMATQLTKLQETVSRTERMRLLGQVAGGLAHQLRNGVTGAQLAVQLHEQSCTGGDAEALDVALRQLTRVTADLQRFFDLGNEGRRHARCSLTQLVSDAVELLLPQCRHGRIELTWAPPPTAFMVDGDPGRVAHLVFNVIGNAVEAAGCGGAVDVQLTESAAGRFRLEISDTGPGPPPELAPRLFEPFVTGKPEGIGLGLAVAKEVADAHGGRISWRRGNERTVFTIELPAAPAADHEAEHGQQATAAH